MNFSFEQLLAFVTVYNERSFSKAAVKLNKHRTTIGQVVTNLEDQLAVSLFERIGRSVEPTEDGELLYHYAKQTIEQARTFDKVALSLSYGGLENITIAYSSVIPHKALSDIRLQLAKDFPMMRVNFIVRNKSQIKQGLQSGEIHFGLVNVHDSRAIHSLDATFLGHLEFLAFVQKGGVLSKLKSDKAIATLSRERQFVLRSLVEEGMRDKVVLSSEHEEVDQLALIIKMVGLGLGWTLLPKSIVRSKHVSEDVEILKVDQMIEGFKFGMALWCPHSKQISDIKKTILKAVHSFIDESAAAAAASAK
ncbi:transcriptional regulators [Vibrio ishigakensis]|uniref:Transcriptional regulators n=1 Tax=Vibrio ishigakensis TaxID=1481914 RepID=A0A0B8QHG2_9VIBR|nr:transcriptional regulators [Vibrio ishigakensis]